MQFGSWAPDLPEFGHNELVTARNVYSSSLGFQPVKTLSAVTGALPETWTGAAAFQGLDGTKVLLAGTGSDLYTLGSTATSKLPGSYGSPWRFAQFGDRVIGVNGGAPVKYTISTDTAASLGGSPPNASMVAIVREFVFLAGKSTTTTTVYWSAQNNSEGWTIGASQCDKQEIPDGGNITGLVGGEYGLVFQAGAIHQFDYVGGAVIFTRRQVSAAIGAVGQGTIAQSGRRVFFLSRNGFYTYEDGALTPIGKERVDKTFFNTYSMTEILARCRATTDPQRSLVVWSMPDRLWVFNWDTGKWSDIYQPGIIGVAQGQTSEVTLEDIAGLYPSIEDVPVSFDDPLWKGGDPMILVALDDNKLHNFGGSDNMEAQIRMSRFEMFAGRSSHVRVGRVNGDVTDNISLSVDTRARLGDSANRVTVNDVRANGDMPIRAHGRYVQPEITIAEGASWTFVEGLTLEGTPGGVL